MANEVRRVFLLTKGNLFVCGCIYLSDIASVASVREGFGSPFFFAWRIFSDLDSSSQNGILTEKDVIVAICAYYLAKVTRLSCLPFIKGAIPKYIYLAAESLYNHGSRAFIATYNLRYVSDAGSERAELGNGAV